MNDQKGLVVPSEDIFESDGHDFSCFDEQMFCSESTQDHSSDRKKVTDIVEAQIIPRLMVMHASSAAILPKPDCPTREINDRDVNDLNRLLLANDLAKATNFVDKLLVSGVSVERLFLDLFAQSARELGRLWETDDLSFVDVTIGLSGLHLLLQNFGPLLRRVDRETRVDAVGATPYKYVLLLPTPGDQHTFGLSMVAEFFRRRGWLVDSGLDLSQSELKARVSSQPYDIVGFSLGREMLQDALSKAISVCRSACKNKNVRVIVGGRVFHEHPDLCSKIQADAFATSAAAAVRIAEGEVSSTKTM